MLGHLLALAEPARCGGGPQRLSLARLPGVCPLLVLAELHLEGEPPVRVRVRVRVRDRVRDRDRVRVRVRVKG